MMNWPIALWGADGTEDDNDDGDGAVNESSTDTTTITMTQADLDKSIARAASRASRKATKDLRESLGFTTQDDLTAFVTGTRETQETEKTETEKATAALEQERASLANDRKSARTDRINLAVDRAIISDGITDEAKVRRIRTLVLSELTEIGDDVDFEALSDEVTSALTSVKTDVPSMFESLKTKNQGSGDGGANDQGLSDEAKAKAQDEIYRDEYRSRGLVITQ